MKHKIAIIATEFLRDFVTDSMRELDMNLEFKVYPYHDFHEVAEIYRDIPENNEGIITSGAFPEFIIRKSFPDTKRIIHTFGNDDAGIYKLFLQLFDQNRHLDINRIYADLLAVVNVDLSDFLFQKQTRSYADMMAEFTRKASLEELILAEKYHEQQHLKLWQEKKIDLSVTRFSSIATNLKDAGLNIHFAYPSLLHLRAVCNSTIQDIKIQILRETQMAAIMITLEPRPGEKRSVPSHDDRNRLCKLLRRINKRLELGMVIHERSFGFEVLADRRIVGVLTDEFTACKLQEYLRHYFSGRVAVGYGVGTDMNQARIHAFDANLEAKALGESCLINDRNQLIAPLKRTHNLVIPRKDTLYIRAVAERSGLSSISVQKVFSVARGAEGNCLTAKELAQKLSVTVRTANRFLSALREAGAAEIADERKATTKGRPERIFRIFLDEKT